MDYSQTLGNFGFKYTLEFRGKNFIFSFLSDRQKAWFEKKMKQTHLAEINSNELLTESDRDKERTKLLRAVANGAFKFGGPIYSETISTPNGEEWFIQMLLVEEHPEITDIDVTNMLAEKRAEVTSIVALVFADSVGEAQKFTTPQKEAMLADVYQRLMKSESEGGCGQTIETIAAMTDRQKIELLLRDKTTKTESPKPTNAETKRIDAILRQHVQVIGEPVK